jgi:hypothetical protein
MSELPSHVADDPPATAALAPPPESYRLYVKPEPGVPVPPGTQRYRLVEEKAFQERYPVALPMTMLVLVACGVGLSLAGAWGGFVAIPLALAAIAAVWGERGASVEFVPDDAGDFVDAPRETVAESLGVLATPERLSRGWRIVCGVAGLALLALFVASLRDLLVGTGHFDWVEHLLPAAAGLSLAYLAAKGELPFPRIDLPASPWFHSLADPSRPLQDDAPMSGGAGRMASGEPLPSVAPPRDGAERRDGSRYSVENRRPETDWNTPRETPDEWIESPDRDEGSETNRSGSPPGR